MKMIPGWVLPLFYGLLAIAIGLSIYFYGAHQYDLGRKLEAAEWMARENASLVEANSTIIMLNREAREREQRHAQDIANVSAQYQEDLKYVKQQKDRVIADLRAGTQRLRIPIAASPAACSGITPEAFAAAGGRDGAARAELSGEAAEFLVGLASDADEIAHQLTRCQQIIKADRDQKE